MRGRDEWILERLTCESVERVLYPQSKSNYEHHIHRGPPRGRSLELPKIPNQLNKKKTLQTRISRQQKTINNKNKLT